ncbi:ATPase, T2SS/T4P/T4SS family, partial [[Clostridium] symbiosum]|uniref:ATPase, T2SS/T4P/T4SS family n=1 Tax=Clostridium symbiosum TaxID=1512 RepID=UPI00210C46BE
AVIRVVHFEIPRPEDMNIPPEVIRTANLKKGLVLVTGAAGSGKSTTLACIIDEINRTRNSHIITLEDPIEYLHRHNRSVVTQREIGLDTDRGIHGAFAAWVANPAWRLVKALSTMIGENENDIR